MATRHPKCFYCGSPATVDDVGIPGWIAEAVGLDGSSVEHLVAAGTPPERPAEGPVDQLPHSIPSHAELGGVQPVDRLHEHIEAGIAERAELELAQYSARALCTTCADAVSALDEQAKPLLLPMIEGGACRWNAEEQRLLAAWGARAAYTILAVEQKAPGVPKPHRRSLRERGEPHQNVFVGFGRYRANHIGVLAGRLLARLGEGEAGDVEAYSVLAVFGHMALKVFGVHKRFENTRVKPPEGQMVRVWPPHASELSWPPLWSLTETHLESVFMYEPFFRPFEYTTIHYLGPNKKIKAKRKRTEGLGPRVA
jgi:hypothetical protein